MNSYFYIIVNKLNGQRYYGSGTKKNYFGSGVYLHHAIKKYGIENFEKTILKFFPTRTDAFAFEDRFLKLYKISSLENTYNIKDCGKGGDTFTNNPNEESIRITLSISAKASSYLKNKTYDEVHGKDKSFEIKNKLSIVHIGKSLTKEAIEKIRLNMLSEWADPIIKKRRLEKILLYIIIRQKQMSYEKKCQANGNVKITQTQKLLKYMV